MIHTTCKDNPQACRVECSLVIDGREYARLRAMADKLNEWTERRLFGWDDGEDTPATVFESFFLWLTDLGSDYSGECVRTLADGLKMGEALPDYKAEAARRRPYVSELLACVAAADEEWARTVSRSNG